MKSTLLMVLGICVVAVPVFADTYYTLSESQAMLLTPAFYSDTGTGNVLLYSGTDEDEYGELMKGAVGFTGLLQDKGADPDKEAWVRMGTLGDDPQLNLALWDTVNDGPYDGYSLYVSNDNQSNWSYRLFMKGAGGYVYSDWVTIAPKEDALLVFDYGDLGIWVGWDSDVDDIGFCIRGVFDGALTSPSNGDAYHTSIISVVPLPGTVLLGFLGLGYAGMRLRKHV